MHILSGSGQDGFAESVISDDNKMAETLSLRKKRSVNFSHEETALVREGVMKFDKVLTKKFSSGSTPVTKKIQDRWGVGRNNGKSEFRRSCVSHD
ncbi:hypothetical protein DPMN_156579 [Dreissena polymorpha]|uniref:Uncharacterized protein n=1 Tax=Dreissena polymorpha TaxID=45954 RepID=A0A9D4FQ14_DREPO|nr:hypothetical protein DPMN_156579 [Dreissena polymorpha]